MEWKIARDFRKTGKNSPFWKEVYFQAVLMLVSVLPMAVFATEGITLTQGSTAGTCQTVSAPLGENGGRITDTVNEANYAYVPVTLQSDTALTGVRFVLENVQKNGSSTGAIQIIAKDSENNWYNIVNAGWGAPTGFNIPANYAATTNCYIVATEAGLYTATLKLMNVSENTAVKSLALSVDVTAAPEPTPAPVVSLIQGTTVGTVQAVDTALEEEANGVITSTVEESAYAYVPARLTSTGALTNNVRLVLEGLTKDGTHSSAMQILATDTYNWYNVLKSGWGPAEGFPVDAEYDSTTDCYIVATEEGSYSVTLKLVDVANQDVLASETFHITVAAKPAPVPSVIMNQGSMVGTAMTVDALLTEDANGMITDTVDASAYACVPTTLTSTVNLTGVRLKLADVKKDGAATEAIQIIAKDTSNNWYNIVNAGWGAPAGFSVPAGYAATTNCYIVATDAGTYTATLQLVNAADESEVETLPLSIAVGQTIRQATITFNTDGGTEIQPVTLDVGTSLPAIAAPEKVGYTFNGWNQELPAVMPENDMTITAQWTINAYTITFDSKGGTAVAPITQDYDTDITAPAVPTKTGYTFKAWTPALPAKMPAQNLSLAAEWTINKYTVTFDANGGIFNDADGLKNEKVLTLDYAAAITVPKAPIRSGCLFLGWNKEVPATVPAENLTFKAVWVKLPSHPVVPPVAGAPVIPTGTMYEIRSSAGEGGSISPAGSYKIAYDYTITYEITPAKGYKIASVIVDGKNVGAVTEYTFHQVSAPHTITATFAKTDLWQNPFRDIAVTDWYYKDVAFVNTYGIMIGTDKDLFSPGMTLNRATIVTTLWRIAGSPIVITDTPFLDLPETWYTDAMIWATANDIIRGYEDSTCRPTADVTHEQVLAILHRFAKYLGMEDSTAVTAVPPYQFSDWAAEDVAWGYSHGLTSNFGSGLYDLTKPAIRAEIAAYLARFYAIQ